MNKNIMFVGVGGQGSLLASRILGNLLLEQDYDVKVSEIHGMSQRGGSVVTYVKCGEQVFSPIINKGEADFIIAFEQLEALRWVSYLKKGGKMILNTQEINPMPVVTGAMKYPEEILQKLINAGVDITPVDALSMAKSAGSIKAVNVVLLGVLAKFLDCPAGLFVELIKKTVPERFRELNIKAFELGFQAE